MYASRVCGAEASSFTRRIPAIRIPANTRAPKDFPFASGLRNLPFPVRWPAAADPTHNIVSKTADRRSDQGA